MNQTIKDNKSSFWSSVALAAAYIVITVVGIVIMYSDKSNSFVNKGMETFVEASWNKIAQDGIPAIPWVILAIALGAFGQMAWSFYKDFGGEGPRDVSFIIVLVGAWLIGWVIIFSGTVSRYGDSQYQETIPTEQYEKMKAEGTLDSLFPG
jgi:hypothetical protein